MSQKLLVYTHRITPRVTYAFKHICSRMLGVPVAFTSKVDDFVAHPGPKLSYTLKQLGNELHFSCVDLLFEQGIADTSIKVQDWKGVPCFYQVKDMDAAFPYDIFAASFFLLSRYEEYLPQVKDEYGRFPASESIAATHKFLELPVVDIWVGRLKEVFLTSFPNIEIDTRLFKTQMIIEVPQAFQYRKVGFLHTVGGYVQDVLKLRLKKVLARTQVILGLRKDPYDVFTWLVNIQKQTKERFLVFFELGDRTEETTNIKYSKATFQSLIKMVSDYCDIGLLASVGASQIASVLTEEKKRLETIVNRPLAHVKVADSRITIPQTYRDLLEQEVAVDYSMGYPDHLGFRAGTCTPFLFYDLDYEIQTPLLLYPACLPTEVVFNDKKQTVDTIRITSIRDEVKAVQGVFIAVFSNKSLAQAYSKQLFKTLVITHEE